MDSIGNFLTIIRNGVMTSKPFVLAPFSAMRLQIARLLLQEGFVTDVSTVEQDGKPYIKLVLKYVDGESVIHEIKRASTPGRRWYAGAKELKPVIGGLGVSILTTSHGLMTDKQAKQQSVGGEIVCTVW